MAKAARLWIDTPITPPLHGSMGVMGHYFHKTLRDLGYDVECSLVPDQPPAKMLIPIPAAECALAAQILRREETRIFFDRVLNQVLPNRCQGVRNVVFFHGLRYAPSVFLANDSVGGFCTNSDYLRRVLLGLLLFPDLSALARSDGEAMRFAFHGEAMVGSVPLVLPATEFPDGYSSIGEDLPDRVRSELERDQWCGHALRPRKLDFEATAAIVVLLNQEPCRSQLGRPVRLLVSEIDHARVVAAAERLFAGADVSSCFIPVPWIRNTELVEVMRRSDFGLLYDWFPEPFGLYPIESVFHGNPVYTNGVGNIRHLLPPDHGIRVAEAEVGAAGTGRYRAVASSIAERLVGGIDAADCARGRAFIEATYSADRFRDGLGEYLDRLERGPEPPAIDPAALIVEPSPMVRQLHRDAGVLVTDVGELHLAPEQIDLMERARGVRVDSLRRDLGGELTALQALFSAGALSLGASAPPLCRLDLRS